MIRHHHYKGETWLSNFTHYVVFETLLGVKFYTLLNSIECEETTVCDIGNGMCVWYFFSSAGHRERRWALEPILSHCPDSHLNIIF